MKTMLKICAILPLALIPPNLAYAQAPQPPAPAAAVPSVPLTPEADTASIPKQIPLNADLVQRFIASFKEIKELQKGMTGKATDAEDEEIDPTAMAKAPETAVRMNAILKKNGFENAEAWAEAMQSITYAYSYANPENGISDSSSTQQSIEAIKKDPTLSDEERNEALKGIEAEYKLKERWKPPAANIEAVKPFMGQLKAVLESE